MIRLLASSALALLSADAALTRPAAAQAAATGIGVVVMHGKGGSPGRYVAELATGLEQKGYRVANLEMPWSGRRNYDANVAAAESAVAAALDALRAQGAQHLFVAGHSLGGLFALYFGGRHPLAGIIAIAPGGNVASQTYRDKLGDFVSRARALVAAGKGDERREFLDFESSKGTYRVSCTAANYLSWFDPDGAMNEFAAVKNVDPKTPVLYIAPQDDYPPLRNSKQTMFASLPRNPLTRLYEPDSGHGGAPAASIEEIARWTAEVAAGGSGAQSDPRTR